MKDVGAGDDGGVVVLVVGERLRLRLDEAPATGFLWEVSCEPQGLLQRQEDVYRQPEGKVYGGRGQHEWVFVARAPGMGRLRCRMRRPWAGGRDDIGRLSISVEVREG